MASPSFSGLPEELKRMVLSFCDAPALESMSRTSTAFHSEADRLLYGTISVHHRRPQSFACLMTLALNKAKANLVRTLAVTLPDEYNDPSESEDESATSEEVADPAAESRAQDLEPVAGKELASESESVSDDGSIMQDDDYMAKFITGFLDDACQNMDNIVVFSFKAGNESRTEDIDDSLSYALESLSGKPSLRTLLIVQTHVPHFDVFPSWLLRYPNLDVLGVWDPDSAAFMYRPPPPNPNTTMPLMIGLDPTGTWTGCASNVESERSLNVFIYDFNTPWSTTGASNFSDACRWPMRDQSVLGQTLCKDLSLEAYSKEQSVYLSLTLQNMSATTLRGVHRVIKGLFNPRVLGNEDYDLALEIRLREPPRDIARAAWRELKMLFRTLVAQGFRPGSLEIMAADPEDTHPSHIMGAHEIEHGAHMLADVLNDRLVLQWTDMLANVQFLGKNLSYKVARDQSIKWHS
ncbi:hypothetical protein D9611_014511 [Ephemerocybe angulata]|uniref:F-box domain-containing protein n=1 Tax=Ephemerocybe angulata TaxID=980116 RepID=A0A8H5FEI1_9AGAR|nr:hypothetical protein D9611_014511 [Tulosesus angulatus]